MSEYVPIEYPKWVLGQIVESAAEEAALIDAQTPKPRPILTLKVAPDAPAVEPEPAKPEPEAEPAA